MPNWINKIFVGDSLTTLRAMPDGLAGIVLTSPPYNLKNSSGNGLKYPSNKSLWSKAALRGGYETHGDNMPHEDYVRWQRSILTECMRVTAPDGAIFYNHKWRSQRKLLQDRSDIVEGFPVRQIIIWKRAGSPNINAHQFLPNYEVIYLIAKPDFKLVREKAVRHGAVWDIKQESKNPHPAPFPYELAYRVIESTTAEVVLDPFIGSGTTAVAADDLGRNWIGIEKAHSYAEYADKRIQNNRARLL